MTNPTNLPTKFSINRGFLFGVISMAGVIIASNILVQFLYNDYLTYGAFTYPFAFLVTDLMNRLYGAASARRVVLIGFGIGIVCSLIGTQIILNTGVAVPLRVAIGSAVAFITAQYLDIRIFDRLRNRTWWLAPFASSMLGSAFDTALFFTISFGAFISFGTLADGQINWAWISVPVLGLGGIAPLWISLALADWLVKVGLALLALLPFRLMSLWLSPLVRTAKR